MICAYKVAFTYWILMKNVKKNFYLTLIEFFRFANCATWWIYSPVCLDMSLTDARIAEIKTSGWRDATDRNGSASYFSRKNSTSFVWDLILWLIVSKYPRVTCLQVVSTLPLGPGATHVCTRGWFYSAPFFISIFFKHVLEISLSRLPRPSPRKTFNSIHISRTRYF